VAGPGTAGEAGHFAAGTDAEGTPLSLWQPGAHAGAELTGAAGTWTSSSLWIVYFAVPDIDTEVGQAALLGAAPPVSLPGPEPAVLLADNQGALFGLRAVRPT
jgi:hypothetical protein